MTRTEYVDEVFIARGTDKSSLGHDYASIYAEVNPEAQNILEIGVQEGRSLLAWADLFPSARIFGVDIDLAPVLKECKDHSRIELIKCDVRFFSADKSIKFDLLVDDGSHKTEDILDCWDLNGGAIEGCGIYTIEDLTVQQADLLKLVRGFGRYPVEFRTMDRFKLAPHNVIAVIDGRRVPA